MFALGFAALAVSPLLVLVIAFQVLQRTANFAISNPAREVLFTVVDREEKYKAKYLIDGVVFRGGDALFGWVFNLLRSAGAELATICAAAVPVALGWLASALTLGKAQERRATGPTLLIESFLVKMAFEIPLGAAPRSRGVNGPAGSA